MIDNGIRYMLPNEKTLIISKGVLDTFHSYRQISPKIPESGGILLGKVFKDYIQLDKATILGNGDKQGWFFFHRNKKRAQTSICEAFLKSKGTRIYLGEWHTHKEEKPYPSLKDKFEIRRAFRKSKLNLEFIIFIIVGSDTLNNLWIGYYDGVDMNHCYCLNQ